MLRAGYHAPGPGKERHLHGNRMLSSTAELSLPLPTSPKMAQAPSKCDSGLPRHHHPPSHPGCRSSCSQLWWKQPPASFHSLSATSAACGCSLPTPSPSSHLEESTHTQAPRPALEGTSGFLPPYSFIYSVIRLTGCCRLPGTITGTRAAATGS